MAGRRSPQDPSISQLTLPPETILSCYPEKAPNPIPTTSRTAPLTIKLGKEKNRSEAKKLSDQLSAAIDLFNGKLMLLFEKGRQMPDAGDAFDKLYSPEDLEKVIRLEALIDARITKLLARLVALKEFKRTPAGTRPARLPSS